MPEYSRPIQSHRPSPHPRRLPFPALLAALAAALSCGASPSGHLPSAAAHSAPAGTSPACSSRPPAGPPPRPGSPAAAVKAFDSLLDAGRLPEARALCVGRMLRLFDFVALAQSKLAGLLDTCRSHEETLEEKIGGDWAYVKSAGVAVFLRPFMGQDSLASIQAAHLYRTERGWRLAEVEELADAAAPVALRNGRPEGVSPAEHAPVGPSPAASASGSRDGAGLSRGIEPRAPPETSVFPVSRLAPAEAGAADRLRLRAALRDGEKWEGFLPLGPGQMHVRADSPSVWTLDIRKVIPGPRRNRPSPAADMRWLEGNAFLVLSDTLLRATADSIAGGETDPERIAAAVYAWVAGHFRFRLGAALFGTSSEVLRTLTGDCSEAAVLTAALLRARGVPARIALGFASVGRGVFIGHAWCEARLGGAWVGVDAALREFPAGVERLKLAELDGREDMRVAATNLMMRAIGNLDVQIEGAWKGGKPLAMKRFDGNASEAEKYFRDILDGADGGR